jgi:hypothetical protein
VAWTKRGPADSGREAIWGMEVDEVELKVKLDEGLRDESVRNDMALGIIRPFDAVSKHSY